MSSIDAVSSLLSSVIIPTSTTSTSSDSTTLSSFGPDFILSTLNTQQGILGAAYDSSGASLIPPDTSPAGQERTTILTKANALFKAGDYAGARVAVEDLVKKYPGDPTPVYLLGRSYLMEGDYTQAQRFLGQAASLAPDSTEVKNDLAAAQTLSHGEKATTEEVQRLLRSYATASQGLQLGAYALRAWPENLSVRMAAADYYEKVGRADYAGAAYATALKEIPVDQQGDLLKKLETFTAAHSTDPSAHDLLAQAYGNADRLSDAQSEFEQALALSEDDPLFQSGLKKDFAAIYDRKSEASMASGDKPHALEYLEKAQNLSPTSDRKTQLSDLYVETGETALRSGLTNAALSAFTKASSYMPADDKERRDHLIGGYEQLATKLSAAGDLRRAVTARQGAYDLDSKNDARKRRFADAQDTYGVSLSDKGKYREAIRIFKAALKLYPDDANYKAHLYAAQHPS
jgi:tetratricopeptide (TPR) repeat protein